MKLVDVSSMPPKEAEKAQDDARELFEHRNKDQELIRALSKMGLIHDDAPTLATFNLPHAEKPPVGTLTKSEELIVRSSHWLNDEVAELQKKMRSHGQLDEDDAFQLYAAMREDSLLMAALNYLISNRLGIPFNDVGIRAYGKIVIR